MSDITTTEISTVLSRLKLAFLNALELEPDTNYEGLAYRETASWDSVAHMQLVVAIENEFDVMLETEEVLALSSFGEAKKILVNHGISF